MYSYFVNIKQLLIYIELKFNQIQKVTSCKCCKIQKDDDNQTIQNVYIIDRLNYKQIDFILTTQVYNKMDSSLSKPKEQNLQQADDQQIRVNQKRQFAKIFDENKVFSNLQTLQYKNAIYFGRANDRQQKHGIGILIFDNSNILIANFHQDQIRGHFLYFQNQLTEKHKPLYYYGAVSSNSQKIDGVFYIFDRNNFLTWAEYDQSKMIPKCYAQNQQGKIIQYQDYVLTNVYQLSKKKNKEDIGQSNDSGFLTRRGKQYYQINRKQNERNQKQQDKMMTPTQFLGQYLSKQEQQSENIIINEIVPLIDTNFSVSQISNSNNQKYYGMLQNKKPCGYGIIFYNQWPVCYGKFQNGQLTGLGRVQQNKKLILDGIFEKSCLKVGWVINYLDNITGCGNLIQNSNHKNKQSIFQLKQQFTGIKTQKILKFRRRHHVRSLAFVNSHSETCFQKIKQQINLFHINLMEKPKIQQQKEIRQQNFIPPFISDISRVNGTSKGTQQNGKYLDEESNDRIQKDLIQLIKQYNNNISNFQKASRIVSKKLRNSSQKEKQELTRNKKSSQKQFNYTKNYRVDKSTDSKIPRGTTMRQQHNKKQKNGHIRQINKVPQNYRYESAQATNKKWRQKNPRQGINTERKQGRKINLHQIYSKYLRKQPQYQDSLK